MSDTDTKLTLPTETVARKAIPMARGLLDYFPAALAAIAEVSRAGNDKHNPGQELHHARGKSMDHADCILRHLVDRGTVDPEDGLRHSAKIAWRALALLQEELEAAGAPLPRGARAAQSESKPEPARRLWHLDAWKDGGCMVCGGPRRDAKPAAHDKCWAGLTSEDRDALLDACDATV